MSKNAVLNLGIGILMVVVGVLLRFNAAYNAFVPSWIAMVSFGLGFIGFGLDYCGLKKLRLIPIALGTAGLVYMFYRCVKFFVEIFM